MRSLPGILLLVLLGLNGRPAAAQDRLTAALASLPDGTEGRVVVRQRDAAEPERFVIVRRGNRLTVFEPETREYRTVRIAAAAGQIALFDPARRAYDRYRVVGSGGRVGVFDPGTNRYEQFVLQVSPLADRQAGPQLRTGPAPARPAGLQEGTSDGVPTTGASLRRSGPRELGVLVGSVLDP